MFAGVAPEALGPDAPSTSYGSNGLVQDQTFVIAEESASSGHYSTAQMFADLAIPRSLSELEPTIESPRLSRPTPHEQPSQVTVSVGDPGTPRPVDPSVDTSALLRELSGLGLSESDSDDWVPSAASKQPEEKQGLFGRKKR